MRLTSPSDDPAGAAAILDFGNSIQANAQSIKQADSATSFLSASEDAVSAAINSTMRLQELAVSGSSASIPELNSIRSTLLSIANTQSQGKYLFSGTNTQTPPFTNGVPVTYNGTTGLGSQGDINLNVTTSTTVTTNVRGDVVFLGGKNAVPGNSKDIFQAVSDLATGFGPPANPALVQSAQTNLSSILANLLQVQVDLGGRQSGLQDIKDTLSGFNVTLQGLQGGIQNTNYPQAVSEFTADQTMQSATLSSLAKSNQSNLFDFLG
jgi:flagellar hook-associated protein 3 FlgL